METGFEDMEDVQETNKTAPHGVGVERLVRKHKHGNYILRSEYYPHGELKLVTVTCGRCKNRMSIEHLLVDILERLPRQCDHDFYAIYGEGGAAFAKCKKCGQVS